jgi:hypothetical protein
VIAIFLHDKIRQVRANTKKNIDRNMEGPLLGIAGSVLCPRVGRAPPVLEMPSPTFGAKSGVWLSWAADIGTTLGWQQL